MGKRISGFYSAPLKVKIVCQTHECSHRIHEGRGAQIDCLTESLTLKVFISFFIPHRVKADLQVCHVYLKNKIRVASLQLCDFHTMN